MDVIHKDKCITIYNAFNQVIYTLETLLIIQKFINNFAVQLYILDKYYLRSLKKFFKKKKIIK